jgi:hypothetical protein
MTVDLEAATAFLTTRGRVLDRRRLALLLGTAGPDDVLAAVEAYRNTDGGYGWGLEADLRSPESQPAAALHAIEAFADAASAQAPRTATSPNATPRSVAPRAVTSRAVTPRAVQLCDWLASVTLPDGGLPFALPLTAADGCAPWWANADPTESSLQITAAVAAHAHRLARHHPAVAAHPWLGRATDYCLTRIAALGEAPHAYVLAFSMQLVDTVAETNPTAAALAETLAGRLPASGSLHVDGGAPDEALHPLDFSPRPARASRDVISPDVVTGDLQRLAALQQTDGGWPIDFVPASPAAALEWRGYATVAAVATLRAHGLS